MPLPTVIIPGYFARAKEYQALETALNQRGIPTTTVSIRKRDWLPTLGGRSVLPIIRQIDRTVQRVRQQYQASAVNLLAHSAGGWIARIYLGEKPYDIHGNIVGSEEIWQAHTFTATLITLGTPHTSQERWTRRNLDFVNNCYPGAFYPHVRYICLAGKAVYGEKNWKSWLAYESYRLTCGQGHAWGDGITPIPSAHLAGALNLTLEGVKHAPTSSPPWYGSQEILPSWLTYLM